MNETYFQLVMDRITTIRVRELQSKITQIRQVGTYCLVFILLQLELFIFVFTAYFTVIPYAVCFILEMASRYWAVCGAKIFSDMFPKSICIFETWRIVKVGVLLFSIFIFWSVMYIFHLKLTLGKEHTHPCQFFLVG